MPSWGICPVLDYDIERMIYFVAQNITAIIAPPQLIPDFEVFVSAILRSARLPKATILLGLQYVADPKTSQTLRHDMRQTLTIPFMVASKVLDDKTFINRSWAKISGIDLLELNTMERTWLSHRSFNLHVDLDTNSDYLVWQQRWLAQAGLSKQLAQTRRNNSSGLVLRKPLDLFHRTDQGGVSHDSDRYGKRPKVSVHWDGHAWRHGALSVRSTLQGIRLLPRGMWFHSPSSTFTWNGRLWCRQDKVGGDRQWIRHEDMAAFMPRRPMYLH